MTVESKSVRQGVRAAIRLLQALLENRREVVRACTIKVENNFTERLTDQLIIERQLTGLRDYTILIHTGPARKRRRR